MIVTREGIDYDVPIEIGVWLMEAETRIVMLEGRLADLEDAHTEMREWLGGAVDALQNAGIPCEALAAHLVYSVNDT